jgi:hypothetical protein
MGARRRAGAVSLAVLLGVPLVVGGATPVTSAGGPGAALQPLEPCRLLDTRTHDGPVLGAFDVDVVGAGCDVPAEASALSIVVTAVRPAGHGFVTVWPAGAAQPTASMLNYRAGEIVANGALVGLGDGGRIELFTLSRADLLVDVTGYFTPVDEPVREGRYVALDATRIVDTRDSGRPTPASSVHVVAAVPDDAVAVAVNITTTQSSGPGYFSAYPSGTEAPEASVLNTDRAGQTRAAATIVPVADAAFEVFTQRGDHVIVDITGYFTGASADASDEGLFVATTPTRLVDTRLPAAPNGGPRLWDGGARAFAIDAVVGGSAAAVATTVTMTDTEDAGFVVAGPARTQQPGTSSVNADAAQRTVANAAIVRASTDGVQFWTHQATELVVDVTGWFTGTPVVATGPDPVDQPTGDRRVFVISDSTMAGMVWTGATRGLAGFEPHLYLESCRRLVMRSCRSRDGVTTPTTVVEVLRSLTGIGPEDILLVSAGYDDWYTRFSADFDTVVATARARGFRHIAWVTYVHEVDYQQPPSTPGTRVPNYEYLNAILRAKVDSGAFPEVRIWDLDGYTDGAEGWFYADGVHETELGAWGVADWISRHVRAFDDRVCPKPWKRGGTPEEPCPGPDSLPASIGHPDLRALYPI